jgi:hypothetical protein
MLFPFSCVTQWADADSMRRAKKWNAGFCAVTKREEIVRAIRVKSHKKQNSDETRKSNILDKISTH